MNLTELGLSIVAALLTSSVAATIVTAWANRRLTAAGTRKLNAETNGARGTNWQLFVNELQEDRATLRAELTTATARLTALEARVQSTERLMGVMQADIQELVCGVETFAAQLCADGKDLRWQPSPGLLARYQIKVPPSGVSKP